MGKSKVFIEFARHLKKSGIYGLFIDNVSRYLNTRDSINRRNWYLPIDMDFVISSYEKFSPMVAKIYSFNTVYDLRSLLVSMQTELTFYGRLKINWIDTFDKWFLERKRSMILNKGLSRKLSRTNGKRNECQWRECKEEPKWYEKFSKRQDIWRR